MRVVVVVIAAVLLNACAAARDPFVSTSAVVPSGNWRIESQMDPVTRAPLSSALLVSRSSSNSAVPYPRPVTLQLTCFKDQPMVRLAFQFKVGTSPNSFLGYSFDEKPGRDVDARFLHQHDTVVIEDRAEVAQFVKELATSSVLLFRIRSLNAGRTTAEFRVDGAPEAIKAGFAGCPLSTDPPRRSRTT